ncbi:MAG: hypothetical protein WBE13_03175 [Candidatus Acidiferrum sp.]
MTTAAFKTEPYSDAARRCADIVMSTAIIENAAGNHAERWVAIRLSDGGSDGVTYPTRTAAVTHQSALKPCAYILVPPTGMEAREAEVFLGFHRKAHDAGFRVTHPDDPQIISPIATEQMASQFSRLGKYKER